MSRQQLPPQIKKMSVRERGTGKVVVRYQLTVDVGEDPKTGRRRQVRRRYRTEKEARDALSEIGDQVAKRTFVPRANTTVRQLCEAYIAGKHRIRATSLAKLQYDLEPLLQAHGDMAAQKLTKSHIDRLVVHLRKGGTKTGRGKTRRPWSAVSVNKFISTIDQVLGDALRQGIISRNIAELVDRVEVPHKVMDTYSEAEVRELLGAVADSRLQHAWELALSGLRRGEIAGLRWTDIDLKAGLLSIANNRVSAGGKTVENEPKSRSSRRVLPIPASLLVTLKAAKTKQAVERLALGKAYKSGAYVVSNEIGDPYSPAVLSRYWRDAVKTAGVRHIRLHDARHTCATTMHLQGVPVAVIAAWIGHKDASLTMRLYVHSQDDALKAAAATLDRGVK